MFLLLCLLQLSAVVSGYRQCRPKDPPPDGRICGEFGSVRKPYIVSQLYKRPLLVDFDTCVLVAKQHLYVSGTYPASFSYDKTSGECLIYGDPVKNMKFVPDSTSTVQFWNKHCYRCTNTCPEPGPNEVILNGGFEFSNKSIYPFGDYSNGLVSPGRDSAHAFQCRAAGIDNCYIETNFIMCAQDLYHLSFSYKVDDVALPDNSFIDMVIGSLSVQVGPFVPSDNGVWKTITTSFEHDAEYRRRIGEFGVGFSGFSRNHPTITIDDLSAYAMPYPIPTVPGAPNLVVNGNFETGELAPWVKDGQDNVEKQTKLVSPGYKSKYAIQIHPSVYHTAYQAYIRQKIEVIPGRAYVLRYSYINTRPSIPFLTTAPVIRDNKTNFDWSIFRPRHKVDGWFTFEGLFVPQSTPVTVHIEMEEDGKADNISVREANV